MTASPTSPSHWWGRPRRPQPISCSSQRPRDAAPRGFAQPNPVSHRGAPKCCHTKTVDSLTFHLGTCGNLVDSRHMTLIVFRHLPAVAELEEQLRLQSRGLLSDDEAEELP